VGGNLAKKLLQARLFLGRSGLIIVRREMFRWRRCRGEVDKSDWRTNNYNAFDGGVEERLFGGLGVIQRESKTLGREQIGHIGMDARL